MSLHYRGARFLTAANKIHQLPEDCGKEVAFVGRSNAGKSSAINALTDNKSLVRTSKQPGRTQLIVFFELPNGNRIVDLPGYGFAKVPLAMRRHWDELMSGYLSERDSLQGLVLVVDIRRSLQESDWNVLNWCVAADIPVHIILTKSDKLSRGKAKSELIKLERELISLQNNNVSCQLFSGKDKTGVQELALHIDSWFAD